MDSSNNTINNIKCQNEREMEFQRIKRKCVFIWMTNKMFSDTFKRLTKDRLFIPSSITIFVCVRVLLFDQKNEFLVEKEWAEFVSRLFVWLWCK